ncbi:MAG: archaea-specific SMC-related protein [Halobacteriaceae archaeon]
MNSAQVTNDTVRMSVENVGGIDGTTVEFRSGVTVLTGRNATNRTSFLRALMAALGSDDVSLKGDADEGSVTLEVGGETYSRRLTRRNGTVALDGDPYLDDPELADLFAFLLESNEARRAVRTTRDLRETIMRPIDTEEIQADIEDAKRRRQDLEDRIDDLVRAKQRLPELEERRQALIEDVEAKDEELHDVREQIASADASVEQTRAAKEEFEETLDELSDARNELQRVESRLRNQRQSLEDLGAERESLESELAGMEPVAEGELADLERQVSTLRGEKQSLETTINELQGVVRFNQSTLDDAGDDTFADLDEEDADPTDQLVENRVTCWTCGTTVERDQIESTLDRLRELRTRKMERRSELDDEISDLQRHQAELEERQRQREQLQSQIDYIDSQVTDTEETVESLEAERERLSDEIEALEAEAESVELDDREQILEVHARANRLEFERDQLETELEDVESDIETIESEVAAVDDLREQRDRVTEEIHDLRTRIDRIVESVVDEFNTHMETVLDILEYENLERVWLERQRGQGDEEADFELHVVRTSASGATYEDTVDHLSESEREVVGLVFSLAGYLVYDVHEVVPFMLLDSLEALDSSRIAALVDYLEQFAPHLVLALLSEDAAGLDDQYERVREI